MYFWPSSVCTRAASTFSLAALSFLRFAPPPPVVWHAARTSASTSANERRRASGRIGDALLDPAAELGLPARAIHDLALELAAGRVDVLAARAADHRQHVRVEQDLLKAADRFLARAREAR